MECSGVADLSLLRPPRPFGTRFLEASSDNISLEKLFR